jgi:lactate dehydrogenase-like 2-hydroxyacid dehydrogenase
VLTDATADIALLLMLGAARGASEGERVVRANTWGAWAPTGMLGIHMTGKRLGIYGMGRIGQAVAKRARAFDMTIHYHNRSRLTAEREMGAIFHAKAEDMLPHSDFLSINAPSSPETNGFLNSARIALLPDGAIVVNTARGPLVDDGALIAALKSGKLAAAGLDVYTGEPDINPGYRAIKNAFLLPHLGSATTETRNAMGFKALDNLDAFFAGRPLPSRVA